MLDEPLGRLDLVTRQLSPSELRNNAQAASKLGEEWAKLTASQTWGENEVCEYEAARKRVLEQGRTAHFGRFFDFVAEKHSELPPATRKYTGRVGISGKLG